jgi:hypothetical protein
VRSEKLGPLGYLSQEANNTSKKLAKTTVRKDAFMVLIFSNVVINILSPKKIS